MSGRGLHRRRSSGLGRRSAGRRQKRRLRHLRRMLQRPRLLHQKESYCCVNSGRGDDSTGAGAHGGRLLRCPTSRWPRRTMANPRVRRPRGPDALCRQGPVDGGAVINGKASLADAFRRMVAVIQLDHDINGSYDGLPVLAGVNVAARSPDDEFRVDKLYKLTTCNREPDICLD